MKKRILVCGASGFIGRNLFEALSARPDLEVYGTYLNNQSFNRPELYKYLQRADLADKVWTKMVTKSMDVVINAAAITDGSGAVASSPGKYITDNIRINTNLIESAHDNNVPHFIFISCSVLYPAHNASPVKETDIDVQKIHPIYTGAKLVKLHGEDLCNFYSSLGRTRFTIIRHSNIYGPYDKFDATRGHVFAATIAKVMTADEVAVWGNGFERRDFLHISDLVGFFEIILDYGNRYDVINVGSGSSLSVRELVAKINRISEKNLPVRYDTAKSTIDTDIVLDITRARQLGWQPKIDIDQGIRQTIEWYKKNNRERSG